MENPAEPDRPGNTLLLNALRHRFLVFLGVAVGVAAAAITMVVLTPSRYDATSIVGVTPSANSSAGGDAVRLAAAQVSAAATDGSRLASVAKAAGVPAGGLAAGSVHAEQVPDTGLIELVVSDGNPRRAADLANVLASNLAASADSRQLRGAVVRAAELPSNPAAPARGLYAGSAIAAGIGTGLMVVLVLETLWPVTVLRHSA